MNTTFSALKVWLTVAVIIGAFGCAKKDDGNNNNGSGYGYPGYPGGTGYSTGTGVGPGGLIASAAGLVNIPGDCGGNQNIDFEIFVRAGGAGGSTNATVDGQVRMMQSDCLCNIALPGPSTMTIIPQQSTLTVTGGTFQTISGRLAVQGPFGIFFIGIQQARLESHSSGPAVGRITGNQFPYMLTGSVQPGSCSTPSMMTDWSFDAM